MSTSAPGFFRVDKDLKEQPSSSASPLPFSADRLKRVRSQPFSLSAYPMARDVPPAPRSQTFFPLRSTLSSTASTAPLPSVL